MRGLRRTPAEADPETAMNLGPRHRSALAVIGEDDTTVGALATTLDLTLATASGIVADLERAGFVERSPDPADRRRTIVTIAPGRRGCVDSWLEGASAPLVRALEQLTPRERTALVKAMGYLDTELNNPRR
jgi:DNA-binding MarR family transcriptional regulator